MKITVEIDDKYTYLLSKMTDEPTSFFQKQIDSNLSATLSSVLATASQKLGADFVGKTVEELIDSVPIAKSGDKA